MKVDRVPYDARGDIFVIVAVNISGAGHLAPRDIGMARLDGLRETPGRFGNDFETADRRKKAAQILRENREIHAGDITPGVRHGA